MDDVRDLDVLVGLQLRYLVTSIVSERGPCTVADLVRALDASEFTVRGRPSKTVSDALRWEVAHGRIVRLGWGTYGLGTIPRSTMSRIRTRVGWLHQRKVAAKWTNATTTPRRAL